MNELYFALQTGKGYLKSNPITNIKNPIALNAHNRTFQIALLNFYNKEKKIKIKIKTNQNHNARLVSLAKNDTNNGRHQSYS